MFLFFVQLFVVASKDEKIKPVGNEWMWMLHMSFLVQAEEDNMENVMCHLLNPYLFEDLHTTIEESDRLAMWRWIIEEECRYPCKVMIGRATGEFGEEDFDGNGVRIISGGHRREPLDLVFSADPPVHFKDKILPMSNGLKWYLAKLKANKQK